MKAKKEKGLLELAYAPPGEKRSAKDLPGPWYDASVVALFVFFAIAYFA